MKKLQIRPIRRVYLCNRLVVYTGAGKPVVRYARRFCCYDYWRGSFDRSSCEEPILATCECQVGIRFQLKTLLATEQDERFADQRSEAVRLASAVKHNRWPAIANWQDCVARRLARNRIRTMKGLAIVSGDRLTSGRIRFCSSAKERQ